MYRRLDQSFRAAYCRLWKGMILTDADLVQSAAREMGLGEFAEVRWGQHVQGCATAVPHLTHAPGCTRAPCPPPLQILPLLFIYRPVAGSSSTDVGKRMSPEQRQRLKQQFKGTTMKDVNLFLQRLPRDMLFVMRSTNLVRMAGARAGLSAGSIGATARRCPPVHRACVRCPHICGPNLRNRRRLACRFGR